MTTLGDEMLPGFDTVTDKKEKRMDNLTRTSHRKINAQQVGSPGRFVNFLTDIPTTFVKASAGYIAERSGADARDRGTAMRGQGGGAND